MATVVLDHGTGGAAAQELLRNARIIGHVSGTPLSRVRLHQKDGGTIYLDPL